MRVFAAFCIHLTYSKYQQRLKSNLLSPPTHRDPFNSIDKELGPFDIDLFASRINYKLKPYISWKQDPQALFCNAFHFDWENLYSYCFPPFSMIPKVLKKVMEDKATICLIYPEWPTKAWWPRVQKLSRGPTIRIPRTKTTLLHPTQEGRIHPLHHKLTLLAGRLSGRNLKD